MRTVAENRAGLNERYEFDDLEFVYGEDRVPEQKSCFYDFGAKPPASFARYSAEPESAFVKSLAATLLD